MRDKNVQSEYGVKMKIDGSIPDKSSPPQQTNSTSKNNSTIYLSPTQQDLMVLSGEL